MSALVTITLDNDRLLDDQPGAVMVEKVADYPAACLAIRGALHGRKTLTIGVRNRTVAVWLTAYVQGYGETQVAIRKVTPRAALAERWQIELPAAVSDADIMEARLLEVTPAVRTGQSFTDLILTYFYSDLLAYRVLPTAQLGALLNSYDAAKWKATSTRPLVFRLFKERFQQWHDRAQSDAVRAIVVALRDDPEGLRRDLCHYKVLRNYLPGLGQKVIGSRYETFRRAKIDTDAVDLIHGGSEATNEIEYHLSGLREKIDGSGDVETLLSQMSGCLDTEFRFVEGLLRDHPEWISSDLLGHVRQRFNPIQPQIGKSLATLRKLIKPAFPAAPQEDWNAEQWIAWVQDSYMPYYAWLEVQNRHDDTVAEYACTFADWFYANFVALKNGQPDRFAFTALYDERHLMKAKDAVTLALILDNFNFVHFEELCRLFQAHGMSLAGSEPRFSLIPTATEVGKAALIATTGDLVDLPTNSYPGLVAKNWDQGAFGQKATYLPNIGALQQLSTLEHDIYFLNYLPIDEALHEDAQETGRSHAEVIYDNLTTIAQAVAEFAHRFQLQKRLTVYTLSDHGATRIAKGVVNVLDAAFYKSLSLKNHHRFVALADDKFNSLPQAASQQCYLIDRNRFKTNQNYLAARQYYRFLSTTENFYVHGGLTPEEVVVPFAWFTFAPVIPNAPTIGLLNSQYRYAVKSRLPIEIGNPNAFPLEAITIRLLNADSEEILLDKLGAKVKTTVELTTTFRKAIGGANTRTLTVRVKYNYQGTEYTVPDKEFTITMKALMEEKDDFDDLF